MSACDDTLTCAIRPSTAFNPESTESEKIQRLLAKLDLNPHPEGGYFVETDRDPFTVPNPFWSQDQKEPNEKDPIRSASTSIYYLLTPAKPKGNFHRNKGRTIHTLHQGRGRYVIIHANEAQNGENARIETFVVGHNVQDGEKLQWVVEGGKYKASFLLPDAEDSAASEGLLISEVMKPSLPSFAPCSPSALFSPSSTDANAHFRPLCQDLIIAIMTS